MARQKVKTRIKLLKNTDAYFLAKNPITINGEIYIVEIGDGVKFKIGNGSAYADLNFYEDNLLQTLGFDLKDVQHGQILMYNSASQKWENVNLADNNSIIYLDEEQKLSIKGYDEAKQGQMLVKDATLGLTWITPVSNDAMNTALDSAQRLANQAGAYATQAGTSATNADLSARQAERINQVTMDQINEKFWWGTLEEYNALEYINEGTFYYIQV